MSNPNMAPYHVSCYEVQSRGQQITRWYFSSTKDSYLSLLYYKRGLECLSYLIIHEDEVAPIVL
jgi:hypothetical protein